MRNAEGSGTASNSIVVGQGRTGGEIRGFRFEGDGSERDGDAAAEGAQLGVEAAQVSDGANDIVNNGAGQDQAHLREMVVAISRARSRAAAGSIGET